MIELLFLLLFISSIALFIKGIELIIIKDKIMFGSACMTLATMSGFYSVVREFDMLLIGCSLGVTATCLLVIAYIASE